MMRLREESLSQVSCPKQGVVMIVLIVRRETMACSIFIAILGLICLFNQQEYHLNQCASSSTINETLNSEDQEEDKSSSIG